MNDDELVWPSVRQPLEEVIDETDVPEPTHGPGSTQQDMVHPGKALLPTPFTWSALMEEVRGKGWKAFVAARRPGGDKDLTGGVVKVVTNEMVHGNTVPAFRGTNLEPAAAHDPIYGGKPLPGQDQPIVTVTTRESSPFRLFFVRIVLGTSVQGQLAVQLLGKDPARRSALIVNEDAANSVSLATRLEHCTVSGTLTFTLGPGKSLTVDTVSEIWGIAVAGTPAISIATETG